MHCGKRAVQLANPYNFSHSTGVEWCQHCGAYRISGRSITGEWVLPLKERAYQDDD